MNKKNDILKQDFFFFLALFVFATGCFIKTFEHVITQYNTTVFAMNYKYGFISRGMMGSIYYLLDKILPGNQMTYHGIYWFTFVFTILFFAMLFLFFAICLNRANEKDRKMMQYFIILIGIFAFPVFESDQMYGRLDIYLYILSLIMVILIITEKSVWLVLPISIFCMCIHHGFIFTNFNLIAVLLFARCLMATTRRKKQDIIILVTTCLCVSALFFYFEMFSHHEGSAIYGQVVAAAKALSLDKQSYNTSIINHEILGKDVFEDEWPLHLLNYQEFPAFLILIFPYLWIGIAYFIRLFQRVNKHGKRSNQWLILSYLLGGATILPEMILKVDYGRYVFMTFFYYLTATLSLLAMKNCDIMEELMVTKEHIKAKLPLSQLLIVYLIFLTPNLDVIITYSVHKFSTLIFWFLQ